MPREWRVMGPGECREGEARVRNEKRMARDKVRERTADALSQTMEDG